MISSKHLAQAIYEISKDSEGKEDLVVDTFLTYVKNYKLESLLPKVINYLEDKVNKDNKWDTLHIKSKIDLSEDIKVNIKHKLKVVETTNIKSELEENLIGGFLATYKGVIYDASIYNQLQLLRNSLTK